MNASAEGRRLRMGCGEALKSRIAPARLAGSAPQDPPLTRSGARR